MGDQVIEPAGSASADDSEARRISIPDLQLMQKYPMNEADKFRERVFLDNPSEFEQQNVSQASSFKLEPPPILDHDQERRNSDSSSEPGNFSPRTLASVSYMATAPHQLLSLQEPPPAIRAHRQSVSDIGPTRPRVHTVSIMELDSHQTAPVAGSLRKLNSMMRDFWHHASPKTPATEAEKRYVNEEQQEADLFALCAAGNHTQDDVRRVFRLLREDKHLARSKGSGGKLALHRLCEAPCHTSHSVEICNALLKTHKKGAKTPVGVVGGGHLPVHLLCVNDEPTEHSEAILRLVIHAYEDCVEKPGFVGTRKMLPLSMICEGRRVSQHSVKMFKRLLEVNKENVKIKAQGDGRTLLHRLCLSTRHLPHTEWTVGIVQLILDVHRRAPEVPDADAHRPLHILTQSEALTAHSVAIAAMLLRGCEQVAGMPDAHGEQALHHLCSSKRLSHHSQAAGPACSTHIPVDFGVGLCVVRAVTKAGQELCRLLLECCERSAQAQNREGRLPLHLVCASQRLTRHSVDVCRQLLLAHKQGFGATDCNGQLPVHVLCATMTEQRKGMSHAADILDQLMWTDRGSVEAEDHQQRMPIHVLCASGLFSAHAAGILGSLVKECPRAVSTPDQEGYLPLHLLLQSAPHTTHTVEGYRIITKVLEENPRSRNAAQSKALAGQLPLHCLCGAGWHTSHSVQMFRWLVEQNAEEVHMPDATGMTPLHWLCSAAGHSEHSEVLYDHLEDMADGASAAHAMADNRVLPLHVLCGAGKHTEHSVRIFRKLVKSHPGSLEAKTAKDTSSGARASKWRHPVLQRHRSNASTLFSIQASGDRDSAEAVKPELSETASVGTANGIERDAQQQADDDVPVGRLPLHFLCAAEEHTESSVDMCRQLLALYPKAVTAQGADAMIPLHLLCTASVLTKHSVEVCALVVEQYEILTNEDELDLRPLLLVCQSQSLSAHSVQTCKLLLESQGRQQARRKLGRRSSMESLTLKWLPLHDLCRSDLHTVHSAEICRQFLEERQAWASTPGDEGFLPLHCLCQAPKHTASSVDIAQQLLEVFPDAVRHESSPDGCLPLHVLAKNPSRSEFSVAICDLLLRGVATQAARMPCASGLRPLHLLCALPAPDENSVELCRLLLKAHPPACSLPGNHTDRDLPLHRLCRAEPHTEHSVKMCELLVAAYPRAVWERGNAHYLDDDDLEDKHVGDDPLMTVCKGDMLNQHSSRMCPMLVTADHQNLGAALHTLSHKVYRPKGNEELQKMALRNVIRLSYVAGDVAVKYIDLDESNSGPHSLNFMKMVVDELGLDSQNPLHHVLRVARLSKSLSDQETSSVLVARLSRMSNAHLEWAAEMVECLPGKVAKRAIWAPEKHSDEFMQGDSPIGIALELGDLKIVSHGAVFDVVKEAWPGKYTYEYNPFTGSIYNNLILEYRHSAGTKGSVEREFHFTWKKRFKEVANPKKLIRSPMMMYFVGIFLQTMFLFDFHVVVEQSSEVSTYDWSLGPAVTYLIVHVAGGILYELGQLLGEGIVRYSKDPWNVVDVSMYSLLTIWFVIRVYEASELSGRYVPEESLSIDFLGIAGIFIWLRMLNVFGLDQNFGPLVKVIQGMVLNVTVFLVLLTVFLAGFATALRCIFKRHAGLDLDAVADSKFDVETYRNQAYSMLSLLNMSLGNFELVRLFSVSELAFCVTLAFLACTYIMLFNMLIAMMTDTYAKIRLESEQLWKKDRALLMASYTKTNKMLDRVNVAGTMTALPQPLNLLMVLIVLLALPVYLPARYYWTEKRKGWQNIVNELQRVVIYILLFVFVTLPLSLLFLVVVLPLNWFFVVSPGLFEYLGVEPFHWLPLWAFDRVSQVVGVLLTPCVFAAAVLSVPVMRLRKHIRRAYGFDSYDTIDPQHILGDTSRVQAAGSDFGFRPQSLFRSRRMSSQREFSGRAAATQRRNSEEDPNVIQWDPDDTVHLSMQPTEERGLEIWEEDLDEDDKNALRAIHRSTMPLDNMDEGSAESKMSKEEQAMQEMRAEVARKIAAVDGTQRTLLQTTRDLQIESTHLQQNTSRALAALADKVKELKECMDLAAMAEEPQEAVAALHSEQMELMRAQARQQADAQRATDKRLEDILATLYEQSDPTWQESGIDDGGATRDIDTPPTPTPPHPVPRLAGDALSVTNPSPVVVCDDRVHEALPARASPFPSPRGWSKVERRGRDGRELEEGQRRETVMAVPRSPAVGEVSAVRAPCMSDVRAEHSNATLRTVPAMLFGQTEGGHDAVLPPGREGPRLRVLGRGRTIAQIIDDALQQHQAETRRQLDALSARVAALAPSVETLRDMREQQDRQLDLQRQMQKSVEQGGVGSGAGSDLHAAIAAVEERVSRRAEESMRDLMRTVNENSERGRREMASMVDETRASKPEQSNKQQGCSRPDSRVADADRPDSSGGDADRRDSGRAQSRWAQKSGAADSDDVTALASVTVMSRRRQPRGPKFGPELDRQEIELLPYAHVQAALFAQAQRESARQTSGRRWFERDAQSLSASDVEACVAMYNTWRTFRGLPVPAVADTDEVELRPFAYVRAGMFLSALESRCPWHEVAVVQDDRVPHVTREAIGEAMDMLGAEGISAIGLDFATFQLCWRQRIHTPTPPLPQ